MHWYQSSLATKSLKVLASGLAVILCVIAAWNSWVDRDVETFRASNIKEAATAVAPVLACPRIRYSHRIAGTRMLGGVPVEQAVFTVENESAQTITLFAMPEEPGSSTLIAIPKFALLMGNSWWEGGGSICGLPWNTELRPRETREVVVNVEPLLGLPDGLTLKMGMDGCWSEPFTSQEFNADGAAR